MLNRCFKRLTNAFSKKFENHAHMVAIYAVWYNWVRIHKTLRARQRRWPVKNGHGLDEKASKPERRGPCKKRSAE